MGLLGKLCVFSVLVLASSFLLLKLIDLNKYDEQFFYFTKTLVHVLMDLDFFFKSICFNKFFRGIESIASNLAFFVANRSDLNVEIRNFDNVEVIMFSPLRHEKKRPAIIYFHGGGYKLFNPKFYSLFLSNLARRLNTFIVAVNYRKAPEYPYPLGFNDALTATEYFLKNAERFDVDPSRIALMGDSAGGNLVITVGYHLSKLKKLDKTFRVPKVLIPLNPSLQIADLQLPSYRDDNTDCVINKEALVTAYCHYAFGELSKSEYDACTVTVSSNEHLNLEAIKTTKDNMNWQHFLSGRGYHNRPESTHTYKQNKFTERLSTLVMDPLFSPLSALNDTELAVLPPVYAIGGSRDPLRDDAKILVARLRKIGHSASYQEFNHCHISYFFEFTGIQKSINSFNFVVSLFDENAIL